MYAKTEDIQDQFNRRRPSTENVDSRVSQGVESMVQTLYRVYTMMLLAALISGLRNCSSRAAVLRRIAAPYAMQKDMYRETLISHVDIPVPQH